MKALHCLLFAAAAAVVVPAAMAQTDAAGCKDSPLLSRFPGSYITECDQKADQVFSFIMGSGKPQKDVEGNYLRIQYAYPKSATKAQVERNLSTAVKNAGYTFDYDSGESVGDFTVHSGKTMLQVETSGGGWYKVTIVVQTQLAQEVVAHLPTGNAGGAAGAGRVAPEQPDAKGCKDSPLIGRFPGGYITECREKADDTFAFVRGSGKPDQKIEGHLIQIQYNYPKSASKAQVVRNMNTAMRNAGYIFDYDSGDYGDFGVHMGKTWIQIEISGGNYYKETFVEETALTQDVVANAGQLGTGLKATGHIVVSGIYFDTAKADVKPESTPAIEQVAKMLQGDPSLKVYVVGHTDNQGGLASNMDLSKRRAASVVQVLVSQFHIAADRLAPYGDGPYAPIQSNDSEAGRAFNRRVELVKQ